MNPTVKHFHAAPLRQRNASNVFIAKGIADLIECLQKHHSADWKEFFYVKPYSELGEKTIKPRVA
jgi:hypothetical protein